MVDVLRRVERTEAMVQVVGETLASPLQPPAIARRLRQVRIVPDRLQREQEEHTRRATFIPRSASQAPHFIHDGGYGQWDVSMDE